MDVWTEGCWANMGRWTDKAREAFWQHAEKLLAAHTLGLLSTNEVRNKMGVWTPEEPESARDAMSRLDELQRLVEVRRHIAVPSADQFQGPLYAVRCWSVDHSGGFLCSTGASATWESATYVAECNAAGGYGGGLMPTGRRNPVGHPVRYRGSGINRDYEEATHGPVPAKQCQCGIHAYRTYDDWKNNFQRADAVGVVSLEGRVQIHTYGYRAAKATMVAVACVGLKVDQLRAHYPDVPFMEAKAHRDDAIVPFLKEMMDEEWSERLFAIGGGYEQKELDA